MEVFEAVESRRSVKHYDPEHRMTEQEERQLLSAALLSPTSYNIQNWRFLVVRDPEVRQKLRAAAWNQAQVTDASTLIILAGDKKAHARDAKRYWRNAPDATRDMLAGMIEKFYGENEQAQHDEVLRSTGIAAQTIMLAAKAMGYDSCPMVGYDPVKVAEIVNLPDDYMLSMMITVGKKVQDARPRGGQLDYDEVVKIDSF